MKIELSKEEITTITNALLLYKENILKKMITAKTSNRIVLANVGQKANKLYNFFLVIGKKPVIK